MRVILNVLLKVWQFEFRRSVSEESDGGADDLSLNHYLL
jgi:hypothetical protein